MPVAYWYPSQVVGDTLVISTRPSDQLGRPTGWVAYDAGEDEWRVLPDPPRPARDLGSLTTDGHLIYTHDRDSRVMMLDVGEDSWSLLPTSDEQPALEARSVVPTDVGVVVSGEIGRTDEYRAEIFEGTRWRRFADPVIGGHFWHWTGQRLLDPDPQVAGSGEPAGGRLDPRTGETSRLPDLPSEDEFQPGARGQGADGSLVAIFGLLYDDAAGTWTPLPLLIDTLTQWSGVMAEGRLFLFGGFDAEEGYIDNEEGMSSDVWVLGLDDVIS